jgi:hypothetical protein
VQATPQEKETVIPTMPVQEAEGINQAEIGLPITGNTNTNF